MHCYNTTGYWVVSDVRKLNDAADEVFFTRFISNQRGFGRWESHTMATPLKWSVRYIPGDTWELPDDGGRPRFVGRGARPGFEVEHAS